MQAIMAFLYSIRIADVVDILIVAFVVYKILIFIQSTRAEQLVKGLILLLVMAKVSEWFNLYSIYWILKNTMTIGIIALIIVFQPELRRALEYLGRTKLLNKPLSELDSSDISKNIGEIVEATSYFSKYKIGSLIIFEREIAVGEVIESGTRLNADISAQLLMNLFTPNTPLHDGAVVVRGDKILAAGCVLPLTENKNLSKDLGTRHRAGIGITEVSDSLALMVSEETGTMSISMDGKMTRQLDAKAVERILANIYGEDSVGSQAIMPLIRKLFKKS